MRVVVVDVGDRDIPPDVLDELSDFQKHHAIEKLWMMSRGMLMQIVPR